MARLKRGESVLPTHESSSTTLLDAGGEADVARRSNRLRARVNK